MTLKRIEIKGFRGFEEEGLINLAIPNGKYGSGLTILVGPNNSGKS
jgi:AAA15 family ATPase/GTPase